jgi:hypothetical protein
VTEDSAATAAQLDALQPDGNFSDDPSPDVDPEVQRLADAAAEQRAANRAGPRHPAHAFHDQWLADHGRPPREAG